MLLACGTLTILGQWVWTNHSHVRTLNNFFYMKGLRFVKMLVGTKCFNVQNFSMLWSVWHYSSRTKALTWTISLVKFLTKYFNFWGFVLLVVKFRRNGSMAQMVQVPFCIPWQLFCYSRFCSKPVWDMDALVDLVFLHDCGLWWDLCWAVSLLLHCKHCSQPAEPQLR